MSRRPRRPAAVLLYLPVPARSVIRYRYDGTGEVCHLAADVSVAVEVDPAALRRLAERATRNKTRRAKVGPLVCRATSAPVWSPWEPEHPQPSGELGPVSRHETTFDRE